jgi:glucose/arabinose dehydrogenase
MRPIAVLLLAALSTRAVAATELSTAGNPSPASLFDLEPTFVSGVSQITDFRWLPDGRMVILRKTGEVTVRLIGGSLASAGSFSVDMASEKGLLGVAVDPQFATNQRLYFYYSAAAAVGGTDSSRNRVVVRTLNAMNQLGSESTLLENLRGPANNDGGGLEIGADGLLYVGVGDSGCNSGVGPGGTVTNFYGTCLANGGAGNGKILRIGLDGSIPADNPLVGTTNVTACGGSCGAAIDPGVLGTARSDIYAWGFRNPWRLWNDPVTGRLWVGDVGEVSFEEIDIVEPGRHHGWPWREADQGYPVTKCHDVRIGTGPGDVPIMDQDCVGPVYRCQHANVNAPGIDAGCTSITGGQIVDSCDWPDAFRGKYFFADNVTNVVWAITPNGTRTGIVGARQDFATIDGGPVTLRTGPDGALYIASIGLGRIVRIAPTPPTVCVTTTTTTSTALTTTTIASATTTTTSPFEACATLTSFERAACELDATSDEPFCPDDGQLDEQIDTAIAAKLARIADLVDRATSTTKPRKVRHLVAQANKTAGAILKIGKRGLRRRKIEADCKADIGALVARVREVLAPLKP